MTARHGRICQGSKKISRNTKCFAKIEVATSRLLHSPATGRANQKLRSLPFAPARWRNPKLHHWIWAIPLAWKKNIPDVDLAGGQILHSFNHVSELVHFFLTRRDASFKQLASLLCGNCFHWLVLAALICQVICTSIDGRTFGVALHVALLCSESLGIQSNAP